MTVEQARVHRTAIVEDRCHLTPNRCAGRIDCENPKHHQRLCPESQGEISPCQFRRSGGIGTIADGDKCGAPLGNQRTGRVIGAPGGEVKICVRQAGFTLFGICLSIGDQTTINTGLDLHVGPLQSVQKRDRVGIGRGRRDHWFGRFRPAGRKRGIKQALGCGPPDLTHEFRPGRCHARISRNGVRDGRNEFANHLHRRPAADVHWQLHWWRRGHRCMIERFLKRRIHWRRSCVQIDDKHPWAQQERLGMDVF
ncbi:MAG: hypothetical protein JXJ18_05980 [Rhodobacteraceae bacterium]|nr:hypothetical protein [Paracoccaceae bacterium]